MSSIGDTCPGPELAPNPSPDPDLGSSLRPKALENPRPRPFPPSPPTRGPLWRSPGPRPLAMRFLPQYRSPAAARGGLSGGASPGIMPRRLLGDSRPPQTAEKSRARNASPSTLRLPGDPRRPAVGTQPSQSLPAQRPPGPEARAGAEARRRVPPPKVLCRTLTCCPIFLQRHPGTAPSWGMKAPASGLVSLGRAGRGDWLPRPPPPGLRLRRLPGWVSRGASCSEG